MYLYCLFNLFPLKYPSVCKYIIVWHGSGNFGNNFNLMCTLLSVVIYQQFVVLLSIYSYRFVPFFCWTWLMCLFFNIFQRCWSELCCHDCVYHTYVACLNIFTCTYNPWMTMWHQYLFFQKSISHFQNCWTMGKKNGEKFYLKPPTMKKKVKWYNNVILLLSLHCFVAWLLVY